MESDFSTRKKVFFQWLVSNSEPDSIEEYSQLLDEIDSYCIQKHLLSRPVMEITDWYELIKIQRAFSPSPDNCFANSDHFYKYGWFLRAYSTFLKTEPVSQKVIYTKHDKTEKNLKDVVAHTTKVIKEQPYRTKYDPGTPLETRVCALLKVLCQDNPKGVTVTYLQDELQGEDYFRIKQILDKASWARKCNCRYLFVDKNKLAAESTSILSKSTSITCHDVSLSTEGTITNSAPCGNNLEKQLYSVLKKLCQDNPKGVTVSYIQDELGGGDYYAIRSVLDQAPWAKHKDIRYSFFEKGGEDHFPESFASQLDGCNFDEEQQLELAHLSNNSLPIPLSHIKIEKSWEEHTVQSYSPEIVRPEREQYIYRHEVDLVEETEFYAFVLSILKDAGHVSELQPIYINHSSGKVRYIDSDRNIAVDHSEQKLLSCISNISFISELKWDGHKNKPDEIIQIYSATSNFAIRNRSQSVGDVHKLLNKYWKCSYSILFVKVKDRYVISFADKKYSHILSDWYNFYADDDYIVSRLDIGNISVDTALDYYCDFIYAIARSYYIYPISSEEASYGLLPLNFLTPSISGEVPATKEEIKEEVRNNLVSYSTIYGDDYVEAEACVDKGLPDPWEFTAESDWLNFDIDIEPENEEEEPYKIAEDDFYDETDMSYGEIDPAIFDDPILMLEWLEKHKTT